MTSFKDEADWTGIAIVSADMGGSQKKSKRFRFRGCKYATQGEVRVAMMLHAMGVPYTPNVRFTLQRPAPTPADPHRTEPRMFIPDFILNGRAYLWNGADGPRVIHGIEAKKGKPRSRQKGNFHLLAQQRRIHLLILSDAQIDEFFFNAGRTLPLTLLP